MTPQEVIEGLQVYINLSCDEGSEYCESLISLARCSVIPDDLEEMVHKEMQDHLQWYKENTVIRTIEKVEKRVQTRLVYL